MGDDQGSTPLCQGIKGTLDLGFGHRVQSGCGFVQNQNRRILQENSGNGHSLLLSTGEQYATLAHIGIKALGHGLDILKDLRLPGSLPNLLVGGIGSAIANIFQNGIGKQEHILLDNTDIFVQALLGHIPDILAVNGNAATADLIEPRDQLAQGGLATTGRSYNGNGLASLHRQRHILQHIQIPIVGKAYILHGDAALHMFQLHRIFFIPDGGLGVHNGHEPL